MSKIKIRMSYTGEKIEGQGVGAATLEQINLIQMLCQDEFEVVCNKGKHDLLHIHTVNPRSFLGAKFSKKPTITHVHFLPETIEGSIKLPKFAMRFFSNYFVRLYKNSDYLVVVNPIFIEDLVRYKIKKERIKYIPNFVSEETFFEMSAAEKDTLRNKYGIKKDAFVVLGVGQVQTRKGVLDFIEIAKKTPDIQYVWAGGFSFGAITDGYKTLKKAIDNPPENVKFLNIIPRKEMNGIYNMADLLFMPSYNELFPMSILEACSAKTPILLRNLSLYEDILFGKYHAAANNEDFVEEIQKLKNDSAHYSEAMGFAHEIKMFYSRENIKLQWISFYQHVYAEFSNNQNKRISKIKTSDNKQ